MGLKVRFAIAGLFGVLFLIGFDAGGQTKIEDILTSSQIKRYQKGDALIEKGKMMTAESDSGSVSRNDSKQNRRVKEMKQNQANVLIKDGFSIKMKVLEDHIKSSQTENDANGEISGKYDDLLSQLILGKKKSRQMFGKSSKTPNLKKAVKYQEDAVTEQANVVALVEKGLMEIDRMKAALPEPVAVKKDTTVVEEKQIVENKIETVVEKDVEEEVVAAPVAVAAAAEEKTEVEQAPPSDVYFTIQIIADKVKVNETRLKMVYAGKRDVIEHDGAGWFRYSVGKFTSYSEAAAAMKKEGIKGYVVAYNGSERISTSEAKKILGGIK